MGPRRLEPPNVFLTIPSCCHHLTLTSWVCGDKRIFFVRSLWCDLFAASAGSVVGRRPQATQHLWCPWPWHRALTKRYHQSSTLTRMQLCCRPQRLRPRRHGHGYGRSVIKPFQHTLTFTTPMCDEVMLCIELLPTLLLGLSSYCRHPDS